MKIGIVGAGFTGLAAAYRLQKSGHTVTVFEKDENPGGLAVGYQEPEWAWSLEKHYHHWFTNDNFILNLAREIDQEVVIKTPKTSVYIDNKAYQLDSPAALLRFSKLPLFDRIRMGASLASLRYNPFWKPLEKVKATDVLPRVMGQKGWELLWEPQLRNKMGDFADEVSLVWFWTRINKRTTSLAYPYGGYLFFLQKLVQAIEKLGGKVLLGNEVAEVTEEDNKQIRVKTASDAELFDKVITTLPSFLFMQTTPKLPETYKQKLVKLKGLGATNLILRLDQQLLRDNTYWLSICEKNSPLLVAVEHTNLIDKKHYNNEHLVYLGNYTPQTDKLYTSTKEELLELYDPILKRINPDYKKYIIGTKLFKAYFAQPLVPVNYSKRLPAMQTPFKNLILANIEQVYPWDRGTNYAVELGEKAAKLVTDES